MATLKISGTIHDNNGAPPGFALPIRLYIHLGYIYLTAPPPNSPSSFAEFRLTTTLDGNGAFSEDFEVVGNSLEDLAGHNNPLLIVGVKLVTQTGDDRMDIAHWNLSQTGMETPDEIVAIASQQHAELTLNLSGLDPETLKLADPEGVFAASVPTLDLIVDTFAPYSVRAAAISGGYEAKLLVAEGASTAMTPGWFRWRGSTVIRSRLLKFRDLLTQSATGAIQPIPPSVLDLAGLNATIPDRINDGVVQMLDTYIEVEGKTLRVHVPSVSLGWGDWSMLSVATVDATVMIAPKRRTDVPFSESEFDDLFEVTVFDVDVNVPAGTNLDDIPWWVWLAVGGLYGGAIGGVIEIIAAATERMARIQVKARILDQIQDNVRRTIDQELRALAMGDADLEADLREALTFQLQTMTFAVNIITVTGVVGLFAPIANCAFAQASAMLPTFHLLPAFRAFQRALAIRELAAWHEQYRLVARELALIVTKHPMLGARIGFFALRAQALLHSDRTGLPGVKPTNERAPRIPKPLVAYLLNIIESTAPHASSELKEFLAAVASVVRAAPGRTFSDMVTMAAGATPPRPGGERPVADEFVDPS